MALKQSRTRETRRKKPASLANYNPWLMGLPGFPARRPSHRRRKSLAHGLQRRVVM